MQFLVIGRDGDDDGARERRRAARDAHVAKGKELDASGHRVVGVILVGADGEPSGSALVVDFASRELLDEWLAVEPYVTEGVWRSVEVEECRVGPSFARLTEAR